MNIRNFFDSDIPALQSAIDADKFHKGEWKVEHFQIPDTTVRVIEDSKGPITFVLYTNSEDFLRISCVWVDGDDAPRNARAIIYGIHNALEMARDNSFKGIVIQTRHSKLAEFFTRVMKMEQRSDEYLLHV